MHDTNKHIKNAVKIAIKVRKMKIMEQMNRFN